MNSRTRKSLLQSYYRQREIVAKRSDNLDGHNFKPYEFTNSLLENSEYAKERFNRLDNIIMETMLWDNPELGKYLNPYNISALNNDIKEYILKNNSDLKDDISKPKQ